MAKAKDDHPFHRAKGGQAREALDRLEELVVEGLKHGFFEYSIACEIANGDKLLQDQGDDRTMSFQYRGTDEFATDGARNLGR